MRNTGRWALLFVLAIAVVSAIGLPGTALATTGGAPEWSLVGAALMTAFANVEQMQEAHGVAVMENQAGSVVEYTSGESQSPEVYEVTEGYKHLPGGLTLGPGQRFHPTERQVRTGALKGKARPLTRDEHAGLRARVSTGVNADIGVRALPLTRKLQNAALEAGLTEADFAGLVGEGPKGAFTEAQVAALIAQKAQS